MKEQQSKIPPELRGLQQWVCWRYATRLDGTITKEPINPRTGGLASSTNPDTWTDFETAAAQTIRRNLPGVGFVLTSEAGIVCLDLDHVRDKDTGEIEPWAKQVIDELGSYTEVSVSGTGVHVFVLGTLPPTGRRRGQIEMYDNARFIIITGNHLEGTPWDIMPRQDAITAIHARIFTTSTPPKAATPPPAQAFDGDDATLLEKIRCSKQGAKFERLWAGNLDEYGGDQSSADLALCDILAFWSGGDPTRIDRLFRQSGLYRDKWNESRGASTYGARTIHRALETINQFYDPGATLPPLPEEPPPPEDLEPPPAPIKTKAKPEPGPADDYTFYNTDLGNAEVFARLYGDRVRYDYRRHRWLIWNGHRWQTDRDNEITRYAVQAVRHRHHVAIDMNDGKERSAALSWAITSENINRLRALQDAARALVPIATTGEAFDANPMLLGCNNGVIDLRTGELRPGDPGDMITMSAGIDYDEAAQAPRWLQFLQEIFQGDNELIAFIQRAVGYSLCGDISEQCLFLCHGAGCNGKTTFLNVLRNITGDYGTNTAFSTFELRERSGIPNDIAALVGSRLITASETSEARRLNEARVKAITGGDPVTCRFLHGEFFTYQPTYKVWLAMNHKPTIQGTDNGIWRRIRLIPFNVNFEAVRDNTLEHKLLSEAQGILNWAIEGCLLWQAGGLAAPAAVTQATAKYREESDIIGKFLAERTLYIRGAETKAAALFKAYTDWCSENNERAETGTAFGNRMTERGHQKRKTRAGVVYQDLALAGVETPVQEDMPAYV